MPNQATHKNKNPHIEAEENDENVAHGHMGQHAEIIDDTDGNQYPQTGEKFTLLQNIVLQVSQMVAETSSIA